jgi:hypothetical protein
MPYLHWETLKAQEKMVDVIKEIQKDEQSESKKPVNSTSRSGSPAGDLAKLDDARDIKLLQDHLHNHSYKLAPSNKSAPSLLHIRRTLDQSYYWTLKDTEARDKDQVVGRATENDNPRLIMVDQLWMWILDGRKLL